jgi:hypothetical protein
VSFRRNPETTVTWTVLKGKEDTKLFCWTQSGVDCKTEAIPISLKKPRLQLLAIAETGDAVVLVSNGRLECYESGKAEASWTWQIPGDSSSLKTFLGSECPLTNEITGWVLLSASNDIHLYSLSPNTTPTLLKSLPLVDVCFPQCDLIAAEKVISCY